MKLMNSVERIWRGGARGDVVFGDEGKRRVITIGVGVYTQCKRGMLCSDWLFCMIEFGLVQKTVGRQCDTIMVTQKFKQDSVIVSNWKLMSPCCLLVHWQKPMGDENEANENREEANTQFKKTKRTFPKNHFFPFPFFSPLFLSLFSHCLPLFHHHSLLIHTLTHFFMLHTWVHLCWTKNTNDTTSDSFHCLFFLSKLSFSLLFLQPMIQCWCNHDTMLSNHQITFI